MAHNQQSPPSSSNNLVPSPSQGGGPPVDIDDALTFCGGPSEFNFSGDDTLISGVQSLTTSPPLSPDFNAISTLRWLCNNLELWTIHIIYPGLLSQEALKIMESQDPKERKFDCPIFVAESFHNRPRTCNNVKTKNMSELRRHLTRPSAGYPAQVSFLKLCRTCNEDFTDIVEFETNHGYHGELCNNVRSQRRRGNTKFQWESLYRKLEPSVVAHALVDSNGYTNTPQSSSLDDPSPMIPHIQPPSSLPPPLDIQSEHEHQYTERACTPPYALIFDSDSDNDRMTTGPEHEPSIVDSFAAYGEAGSEMDRVQPGNALGINGVEEMHNVMSEVHVQSEMNPWFTQSMEYHHIASGAGPHQLYRDPWLSLTTDAHRSEEPWSHISLVNNPSVPRPNWSRGFFDPVRGTMQSYTNSARTFSDTFDLGSTTATSAVLTNNTERSRDDFQVPAGRRGKRNSITQRHRRGSLSNGASVRDFDSNCEDDARLMYSPGVLGERHTTTVPGIPEAESRSPSPCPSNASAATSIYPSGLPDVLSCPYEECNATFKGEYRRGNRGRHIRLKHVAEESVYRCESGECNKTFRRKDARLKHYRKHHPSLGTSTFRTRK